MTREEMVVLLEKAEKRCLLEATGDVSGWWPVRMTTEEEAFYIAAIDDGEAAHMLTYLGDPRD